MKAIGVALPGLNGLSVRFERQPWEFLLRRADFRPDDAFRALHGAALHAVHLAPFLPNWKSLAWQPVEDSLSARAESWAKDLPYHVSVRTGVDGQLTHGEVLDAFQRFMAQPAA
jgi:hypothetical protein